MSPQRDFICSMFYLLDDKYVSPTETLITSWSVGKECFKPPRNIKIICILWGYKITILLVLIKIEKECTFSFFIAEVLDIMSVGSFWKKIHFNHAVSPTFLVILILSWKNSRSWMKNPVYCLGEKIKEPVALVRLGGGKFSPWPLEFLLAEDIYFILVAWNLEQFQINTVIEYHTKSL